MTQESKQLKPRPPIVVVVGHVDHGKTTLLDYIRKTNVAGREAGGITQSIGAYEITHNGRTITFIDTPGHEAFIKMRSRGATIADLAILVVAADEGVKPQTQESIRILHETETPFIVAITKIDKPNADVEKVKDELTASGILLEGYGGTVSFEPVSAKTGEHVNDLLDLILLAADLEHLSCDPALPAAGYVLEAKIDRRRGLEATVIVKDGTLNINDPVATKTASGKVKILEDFLGSSQKSLEPSAPALIIGFETLPVVGEEFSAGDEAGKLFQAVSRAQKSAAPATPLESKEATLTLILKASDTGSLEALTGTVEGLTAQKPMKILASSVGDVTDNDVKLAISSRATIIAFKSRIDKGAKTIGEANGIRVISSEIIYDLVKTIEGFIAELEKPKSLGTLEVLAVFNQTKPEKQIVGGRVIQGVIKMTVAFDVVRDGTTIGTGKLVNLKSGKQDTHEVREGNEAGLLIHSGILISKGDHLVTK